MSDLIVNPFFVFFIFLTAISGIWWLADLFINRKKADKVISSGSDDS